MVVMIICLDLFVMATCGVPPVIIRTSCAVIGDAGALQVSTAGVVERFSVMRMEFFAQQLLL